MMHAVSLAVSLHTAAPATSAACTSSTRPSWAWATRVATSSSPTSTPSRRCCAIDHANLARLYRLVGPASLAERRSQAAVQRSAGGGDRRMNYRTCPTALANAKLLAAVVKAIVRHPEPQRRRRHVRCRDRNVSAALHRDHPRSRPPKDHALRCHPEPDPSLARTSNNRGLPVGNGAALSICEIGIGHTVGFFAIAFV
jgi:hypothetical protein